MHITIDPKVLYFGTPVVLISTLNEDGSPNLAPMSSAWWLGKSCMLGMSTRSKTVENLKRNGECVLNLPSPDQAWNVNQLALLTGKNPVPEYKNKMGYRYEPNKFEIAEFNTLPSEIVQPPRAAECPVHLEAKVKKIHDFEDPDSFLASIEVGILKVHIDENLLKLGPKKHIDPEKWSPLIMNFCEFFGLNNKVHSSKLAKAFEPYLTLSG